MTGDVASLQRQDRALPGRSRGPQSRPTTFAGHRPSSRAAHEALRVSLLVHAVCAGQRSPRGLGPAHSRSPVQLGGLMGRYAVLLLAACAVCTCCAPTAPLKPGGGDRRAPSHARGESSMPAGLASGAASAGRRTGLRASDRARSRALGADTDDVHWVFRAGLELPSLVPVGATGSAQRGSMPAEQRASFESLLLPSVSEALVSTVASAWTDPIVSVVDFEYSTVVKGRPPRPPQGPHLEGNSTAALPGAPASRLLSDAQFEVQPGALGTTLWIHMRATREWHEAVLSRNPGMLVRESEALWAARCLAVVTGAWSAATLQAAVVQRVDTAVGVRIQSPDKWAPGSSPQAALLSAGGTLLDSIDGLCPSEAQVRQWTSQCVWNSNGAVTVSPSSSPAADPGSPLAQLAESPAAIAVTAAVSTILVGLVAGICIMARSYRRSLIAARSAGGDHRGAGEASAAAAAGGDPVPPEAGPIFVAGGELRSEEDPEEARTPGGGVAQSEVLLAPRFGRGAASSARPATGSRSARQARPQARTAYSARAVPSSAAQDRGPEQERQQQQRQQQRAGSSAADPAGEDSDPGNDGLGSDRRAPSRLGGDLAERRRQARLSRGDPPVRTVVARGGSRVPTARAKVRQDAPGAGSPAAPPALGDDGPGRGGLKSGHGFLRMSGSVAGDKDVMGVSGGSSALAAFMAAARGGGRGEQPESGAGKGRSASGDAAPLQRGPSAARGHSHSHSATVQGLAAIPADLSSGEARSASSVAHLQGGSAGEEAALEGVPPPLARSRHLIGNESSAPAAGPATASQAEAAIGAYASSEADTDDATGLDDLVAACNRTPDQQASRGMAAAASPQSEQQLAPGCASPGQGAPATSAPEAAVESLRGSEAASAAGHCVLGAASAAPQRAAGGRLAARRGAPPMHIATSPVPTPFADVMVLDTAASGRTEGDRSLAPTPEGHGSGPLGTAPRLATAARQSAAAPPHGPDDMEIEVCGECWSSRQGGEGEGLEQPGAEPSLASGRAGAPGVAAVPRVAALSALQAQLSARPSSAGPELSARAALPTGDGLAASSATGGRGRLQSEALPRGAEPAALSDSVDGPGGAGMWTDGLWSRGVMQPSGTCNQSSASESESCSVQLV